MPINIIVAHALEAKALVSMFGLERQQSASNFAQYSNSKNLCLLVSGIGKEAVIQAVTYLGEQQALDDGELRAWLNIGIAGHRDAALGRAWIANKITDQSSGANAYPPQLVDGFSVGSVITVDTPETAYPVNAAYEMEASAFYAQATKYSTAELVQVFKIISDNSENPISELDLKIVPQLIAGQAQALTRLAKEMAMIVDKYNSSQRLPAAYRELCAQLHLTVNQKLQLKRLCQRFKALGQEKELDRIATKKACDAKTLIQQLSEHIGRMSQA